MQHVSPIELITFDLGNVLIKVDHLEFCRRLAELAGVTASEVFDFVFRGDLEPQYDTGKISSPDFHRQITAHYNIFLDFARFSQWWNGLFSPMPEMGAVVHRLAQKYPLFLLSNTNELHFDYIRENYPVLNHFAKFVLSYQVGSRKPERGIYSHLIQEAGVPAGQILFIDDKMPFVAAARDQGIQAWQFTSSDTLQEQLSDHGVW